MLLAAAAVSKAQVQCRGAGSIAAVMLPCARQTRRSASAAFPHSRGCGNERRTRGTSPLRPGQQTRCSSQAHGE